MPSPKGTSFGASSKACLILDQWSRACAGKSSTRIPSMPGAPRFLLTRSHARRTLSAATIPSMSFSFKAGFVCLRRSSAPHSGSSPQSSRAPLLLIHSCLALCLRPSSREGCQLLRPLLTSIRSRHALPRAAPRHLAAFAASFVRVDRQLFHTPGSCSASGPFWLCSRQVTLPRRTDLPE